MALVALAVLVGVVAGRAGGEGRAAGVGVQSQALGAAGTGGGVRAGTAVTGGVAVWVPRHARQREDR